MVKVQLMEWLAVGLMPALTMLGLALGAVLSPQDWARKMIDRVGAAGADWERGMQGASGTIVSRARAAGNKWKLAMQKAIAQDLFSRGLANVTDEDIIAGALKVGGSALVAGVQAREGKILKRLVVLQPKVAALTAQLNSMPTDTPEQAEAKAIACIRGMRKIGEDMKGAR